MDEILKYGFMYCVLVAFNYLVDYYLWGQPSGVDNWIVPIFVMGILYLIGWRL